MATRTRTPICKGVYKDKHGIAIVVSVHGKPREFRRDADGRKYATYTPEALKRERKIIDAREHLHADITHAKGQSLAADAAQYIRTLSGRTKDDTRILLDHWLTKFGDDPRASITPIALREHAATWHCAASTFNHRRQALISLYRALNGPSGYNPAREMPKRRETIGAPKALSYDVIDKALNAMPATKSRARLKLMAYTGLPQAQIKKLTPDDWQGDQLRVTPRRKGSGVHGRWLPLSPHAQAAMQEFSQRKAWGTFSNSTLHKAWKAVGPKGSSPYALRHSWITELYRRSNGDMLALQELSLHSRLEQTARYASAALRDRMTALVLPRIAATSTARKRPIGSTKVQRRHTSRRATVRGKKQKNNAKLRRK